MDQNSLGLTCRGQNGSVLSYPKSMRVREKETLSEGSYHFSCFSQLFSTGTGRRSFISAGQRSNQGTYRRIFFSKSCFLWYSLHCATFSAKSNKEAFHHISSVFSFVLRNMHNSSLMTLFTKSIVEWPIWYITESWACAFRSLKKIQFLVKSDRPRPLNFNMSTNRFQSHDELKYWIRFFLPRYR
jgi:hypothetical protein